MMFYKVLLVSLGLCVSFELKCPEPAQWSMRAKLHCPNPSLYYCLLSIDRNTRINVENCSVVDFEAPGRRIVIRWNIDSLFCSGDKYQPIKYWTNVSSDCLFLTSMCTEEGQVLYSVDPYHEYDTSCICDFTVGYDFVTRPKNPCWCIPSQEDCSCYKKRCLAVNSTLSRDYMCTKETQKGLEEVCTVFNMTRKVTFPVLPEINKTDPDDTSIHRKNWKTPVFIFILVIMLIFTSIVVVFGRREGKNTKPADQGEYAIKINNSVRTTELKIQGYFTKTLVSKTCIEGEDVHFECEIVDDDQLALWMKNGTAITESDLYRIEKQGKYHKLTVINAKPADQGEYSVEIKKCVQKSVLKVLAFIKMHLENTAIMEGLDVILKCEIEKEGMKNIQSVIWLKDGSKLMQSNEIKMEFIGTVYMLKIAPTELVHKGRYRININHKYNSEADLHVEPMPTEIKLIPKDDRENFLRTAKTGTSRNYSIRVMIVGKKKSGKTCLLQRLLYNDICAVQSTDCLHIELKKCKINIHSRQWILSDTEIDMKRLGELANCGVWDFSGQQNCYSLQETFLTPNAIYILTIDMSEDLSQKLVQDKIEQEFNHVGDSINVWMDNIHCYARTDEKIDLQKTNGKIYPPVIIVGTCIDKIEGDAKHVENMKNEFQTHINNLLDTKYKRKHIWDLCTLSNTQPSQERTEFNNLRKMIFETATKMHKWGDYMPTRWVILEKKLKQKADAGKKVINFDSIVALSRLIKFKEDSENKDLISFLKYEHDAGGIIFFENIREYIILDHMWFVDALQCFVAPLKFKNKFKSNQDWSAWHKTGKISESLLKTLFETKSPSLVNDMPCVIKIMEAFDVVLKCGNAYYVPSLSTRRKFETVLSDFHISDNSNRTSWLCLEFTFLPLSFFNHILASFANKYPLSEIDSNPAIYQGIGVFELKTNENIEKLAMCVHRNSVALQVWQNRNETSYCYDAIRKSLEDDVQSIRIRYRINISYQVKLKCYHGLFDTLSDKKDIFYWTRKSSFKCSEHDCIHKSDDIYGNWYKILPKKTIKKQDVELHNEGKKRQ